MFNKREQVVICGVTAFLGFAAAVTHPAEPFFGVVFGAPFMWLCILAWRE